MVQNVSRSWARVFGLAAALLLARCGGTPQISSKGGVETGGMPSASAGTGNDTGGSSTLNTGDQPGAGGAQGEAGAPPESDVCGDGVVGKTEECDDGNSTPGDGCSGICTVEPHYVCSKPGKACTLDQTEVCGNGKLEGQEACDDGNTRNKDGCSSTCTIEDGYTCDPATGVCTLAPAPAVCGNGLVEAGENCDDGNEVDHDGCTACKTDSGFVCPYAGQACIPDQYCGDGVLEITLGEDCDDGNNKPGDGCDPLCHTQAGYLCSPGAGAGPETCTKIWVCGNGIVDPHEACDDKGVSGGCTASCQVVAGFTCSKNPTTGAGTCVPAPKSVCGNAIVETGETCDDGNQASLDGCSSSCKIEAGYSCTTPGMLCTQNERCGDGNVDQDRGEVCDDGNTNSGDGCTGDCSQIEPNFVCATPGKPCVSTVRCGDSKIGGNETCDDGNSKGGDGCSATCTLEPGWTCSVIGLPCSAAKCGDGILAGLEECEYAVGETAPKTGCDVNCKIVAGYDCATTAPFACAATNCGNKIVERGEQCDDGNNLAFDGCYKCKAEPSCVNGVCKSVCGDGQRYDDEQCDDGNNRDNDGCSSTCKIETGFTCTDITNQPPASITLPITLRDFIGHGNQLNGKTPHPDFNQLSGSGVLGIAESTLGANGRMVYSCPGGDCSKNPGANYYAGAAYPNTSGAANFNQWYTDVPGVNLTLPGELSLARSGTTTSYVYDSGVNHDNGAGTLINYFDPLHGQGWVALGNENAPCSPARNVSFTTETHFWFEYQGGEQFAFSGDDDTWVFVNGHLAVDLGGLHTPLTGSFTLDADTDGAGPDTADGTAQVTQSLITGTKTLNFGLKANGIYEVVMFQAERNQCGSNFKVTLKDFNKPKSQCHSTCGDGIVASDEVCDDGKNDGSYGGCLPGCMARGPYCGDNQVTNGEVCDNGVNLVTYGNNTAQCGPNCQIAPYCGDGVTSNGEQCDSGGQNGATGDYGCQLGCKLGGHCGDGILNVPDETCDDGVNNGTPGSACQLDCTPKCGNGTLDPGEACDLGTAKNTGAYNGCNADCTKGPYCGDGYTDPNEECDDGKNDGTYGTCNPGCKQANYCGDGTVTNPPETCDNGTNNSLNAYGKTECTNRCLPAPYCGDRAVQSAHGEKCDDGKNDGTPGSCTKDCSAYIPLASCGNGTLDPSEQCDDGAMNGLAADPCDAHCHFRCGNGIKDSGEECDDGVNSGAYGTCNKNCTLAPYCGDGKLSGSEQCDDGVKNVALATAYGKGVCTSVCTKAPYCGDGRVQSSFEDCDGAFGCSDTCTFSVPH